MGGILGTSRSDETEMAGDNNNETSNEPTGTTAAGDEKNDNNKRESVTPATTAAPSTDEQPESKKQKVQEPEPNNNNNNPADDNPQQTQRKHPSETQRGGKATSKKKVKTKHMDPQILRVRKIIQEGCRTNDLASAMEAYEGAIRDNIRIEAQSYYNLLNLCDGLDREKRKLHVGTPKLEKDDNDNANANSKGLDVDDSSGVAKPKPKEIDAKKRQEYVFAIKERMQSKEINLPLNETAYSAIVKILSKNKEYSRAEEILTEAEGVQQCKPKLRLYASLLHAYCREDGQIANALKCWRRLRQRATSNKSHKGSDKNSENADGMDLTEREYLALIRCAVRAKDGGSGTVMEDVLTRLAEDIPVPAKDTVAAIATWFEQQNKNSSSSESSTDGRAANNNNNNKNDDDDDDDGSQQSTVLQELLDEIRTYDAVSEPSPRMGPVTLACGKRWTISPACSIDGSTGMLKDGCLEGHNLKPVPLSDGSFRDMTTMNESIVTDGNIKGNAHAKFQGGRKGKRRTDFSPEERHREWKRFDEFLDRQVQRSGRPYEVVIDGANIGYFKQNFASAPRHVDYEQIDWVLRHFCDRLGKKALLVMHNRHFSRHMLPHKYRPLCDAWRNEGLLFATPPGMNDDWFWMHAALKYKTLVVTNDEMRDHHFQMLAPKFFLRWKDRHQVRFDFGNLVEGSYSNPALNRPRRPREVLLTHPDVYSRRIQRVADGLVVPLTKRGDENRFLDGCHVASDQEPEEERYLCIRPA
mmetsp:Transcript_10725/g.31269  ORF Transcript_10725/g.31269 Transcript_10725/m.31269 type:complete len:753 (-) Transcript_10725:1022-3280(-)